MVVRYLDYYKLGLKVTTEDSLEPVDSMLKTLPRPVNSEEIVTFWDRLLNSVTLSETMRQQIMKTPEFGQHPEWIQVPSVWYSCSMPVDTKWNEPIPNILPAEPTIENFLRQEQEFASQLQKFPFWHWVIRNKGGIASNLGEMYVNLPPVDDKFANANFNWYLASELWRRGYCALSTVPGIEWLRARMREHAESVR